MNRRKFLEILGITPAAGASAALAKEPQCGLEIAHRDSARIVFGDEHNEGGFFFGESFGAKSRCRLVISHDGDMYLQSESSD